MDAQVELMFANMDKANDALIAKLQESAFVKLYLPLLASTEGGVDLRPWLSVSGNALLPVNVYRGDEFLFQVPPLMNTIPTKAKRTTYADTVAEISETAVLKSRQHHRLGNAYLQAALTPKVTVDPVNLSALKAWNDILVRYDYPPLLGDIIPSETDGGVTHPLISSEETYEDI